MSISSRAVALIVPKPLDNSPETVARYRYNRFAKLDHWSPPSARKIDPLGCRVIVPAHPRPDATGELWLEAKVLDHWTVFSWALGGLLALIAACTVPPIILAALRLWGVL